MSDREQDVAIAKAMGISLGSLCPDCTRLETCFPDVVDFNTPEGSWKILDYVREHDDEFTRRFTRAFINSLGLTLPVDTTLDCIGQMLTELTPSIIKEAACKAAKEMNP